jgi:hypothetical protein
MQPKLCVCLVSIYSQYLGEPIQSIAVPNCCFLLGLVRQRNLIETAKNPRVQAQDWLLAVVLKPAYLPELVISLRRTRKIHWHAPPGLKPVPCPLIP